MSSLLLEEVPPLKELQKQLKPFSISYETGQSVELHRLKLTVPASPDPSWGKLLDSFAQELLKITNAFRVSKGFNPMVFDPRLMASSGWKSLNMAGYLYMDHNDPDPAWPGGRTVQQRFSVYYPLNAAWGENIAYGFLTPQDVFNAWISGGPGEGHYENILNSAWVGCGFAAGQAPNGLIFWTQDFGSAPVTPGPTPVPVPVPDPVPVPVPDKLPRAGDIWVSKKNSNTTVRVTLVTTSGSGVVRVFFTVVKTGLPTSRVLKTFLAQYDFVRSGT